MKEGTVPVSRYRRCAYRDEDVVPVRDLSHLGEQIDWHESVASIQFFFNIFNRTIPT
jgi:hypothetical protein